MAKSTNGKMVYYFGKTKTEGRGQSKALLGGKGVNLAEMTRIKLPVPPGFTITTEVCDAYYKAGEKLPKGLMDQVNKAVSVLEKELKKKFGDDSNPLLVSVRSGAAVSMPGMMNTILNLGLNDKATQGLAKATKNERFAYDAYRRLINMFGDVVMGMDHHLFEAVFNKIKKKYKVSEDTDVPTEGLKKLCEDYKALYKKHTGKDFPQNPLKQLELSIMAVFGSWNTQRAVRYREIEGIRGLLGDGGQRSVDGLWKHGRRLGNGCRFHAESKHGREQILWRVPDQRTRRRRCCRYPHDPSQWRRCPSGIKRRLQRSCWPSRKRSKTHYQEMQDIEFTIERGTLFMLQTRTGKRTGVAAVKIACDMVKEKLIDQKEAVLRVPANDLTQLLLPSFKPTARNAADVLTRGLPASPGASVGRLAFSAAEARLRAEAGESVILVRKETSPEDVDGMNAASGILTSTGGMTSHAAVVARGWGKCCVAGAGGYRHRRKRQEDQSRRANLWHRKTWSASTAPPAK